MYHCKWRCRLCGQTFLGDLPFTEEEVLAIPEKDFAPAKHTCYGGKIGWSDFLGFEKNDEGS